MSTIPNYSSHPKITGVHLQRRAYIYVRQSTMKQVHHNQESQHYQYRLKQRATELGWSADRIRIIDQDLGRSGKAIEGRTGFQTLVAEVSLGQVGIIFGYEVSRLARNNRDWYHLLDLAAVFGTLIADSDGIYDPRLYNDRLLLGLKGTMSEAELHLLRQRLDQGRMAQVQRGVYRQHLPTGYQRLTDHSVVKDPDAQVQHVIGLIFAKFKELGSINRVVRYFRRQQILLPRRPVVGPYAGQVLWKTASESAVTEMLKNPAYAGAFAYGRKQVDPTRQKAGRPATGRYRKPMAEWIHLQQEVYPAYISWQQYLKNQEKLQQNGMRFVENRQKAQGMAGKGPGLLQGLVVCGRCGHHFQVVYKKTPRYICRGLARTADVSSTCCSVRVPEVDQMVVQAFFEAIQPAQLDALQEILRTQQAEREQLDRQWQEQLKRAQYAAQLAQRQYEAVDPDNRLVAAELERRWEMSLRQLQQTQEDYQRFQQSPPPDRIPTELRQSFQQISDKLPDLWPSLPNTQKKELLRSMIAKVIVKRPAPDQVKVRIVWVSGAYTDAQTIVPIHSEQDVTGYDEMVERIHELWQQRYNDQQIADKLTAEGFHTTRSSIVTPVSVGKIRRKRKWYSFFEQIRGADEVDGKFTVNGFAKQIGVDESAIYRYIYTQRIPSELVTHEPHTGIYLIANDEQLIERLRKRVEKRKKKMS